MATSSRSGPSFSYPSDGEDDGVSGRPVLGSGLLVVAGLLMLFVTYQFTMELLMLGSAFTVIGFIFGTLVVLTGVLALAAPELSTPIGMTGIALSILGIIGALGGLLVGTILGIAGGSLLIAWQPATVSSRDEQPATSSKPVPADESGSFDWQRDRAPERTEEPPTLGVEESSQVEVEDPSPVESGTTSSVDVEKPSPLENEDPPTSRATDTSGETLASEPTSATGRDGNGSQSSEEGTDGQETTFAWEDNPQAEESDN